LDYQRVKTSQPVNFGQGRSMLVNQGLSTIWANTSPHNQVLSTIWANTSPHYINQ